MDCLGIYYPTISVFLKCSAFIAFGNMVSWYTISMHHLRSVKFQIQKQSRFCARQDHLKLFKELFDSLTQAAHES
ncbi:hypothetical protein O181_016238 [Austropuccinia psidii MF-1]|uniref:Uncharacterized protein n=1 Tax=Austropuccinia psidii MF-1 TaxID=1389203 RepID=A0A9Q3C3Y7_9BASI|nr:hypothetical protein [Austropuccinia psidii MF-1]